MLYSNYVSKTVNNTINSRIVANLTSNNLASAPPFHINNHKIFENIYCLIAHADHFLTTNESILSILGNMQGGIHLFGYVTFAYSNPSLPSDSPYHDKTNGCMLIESKRFTEYGTQLVFAYYLPPSRGASDLSISVRFADGLNEEYNWVEDSWRKIF